MCPFSIMSILPTYTVHNIQLLLRYVFNLTKFMLQYKAVGLVTNLFCSILLHCAMSSSLLCLWPSVHWYEPNTSCFRLIVLLVSHTRYQFDKDTLVTGKPYVAYTFWNQYLYAYFIHLLIHTIGQTHVIFNHSATKRSKWTYFCSILLSYLARSALKLGR